ncbi:MAG: cupin domain-containing protein [Bryobacteraceae bacterium]|nr:cupin domain-containing protein [Bryobacteraceae bacterium]
MRLLAQAPGWKILLVRLDEDGAVPEHSAPGPITVHCLSGEAEFTFAGERRTLTSGDLITLEAHTPHSLRAKQAAVLVVHVAA